MVVEMDPEIAEIFQKSSMISCKFIVKRSI